MSAEGECEGEPVDLYIYDLTQGLAALLSPAIMGNFSTYFLLTALFDKSF